MISKLIILIILKICYNQDYYYFEKDKPLKLFFQTNVIEENYVYLDFNGDFEISETSQFISHYYLLFKKQLSAICKTKLNEIPYESFTKNNKSDCEIIPYDNNYNILKYEKITNKVQINAFIFYLNTNDYVNYEFEIKKLSVPFRLDNKSHSYNGKGKEIKIFFTQLKDVNNNFYLFLISKNDRISLFIQDYNNQNGIYKKINIPNNKIFKLYDSYDDNYYDGQFILLIYQNKFSYNEKIDIGMKVIKSNENIKEFNLKTYERSIISSCMNKNIFILNTNFDVVFHIKYYEYKSFKYYKKNTLETFDDLDKSENFEELLNIDYYTNNYAIFSVECDKNELFQIEYNSIDNNNKLSYEKYTYYKIPKSNNINIPISSTISNNIIIILLSNNEFYIYVNYEKILLQKYKKIKVTQIIGNYFRFSVYDEKAFNSTLAIKCEIPQNLMEIKYEPNPFEISILLYNENKKIISFVTPPEYLRKYSEKEIIVKTSMSNFKVYTDIGYNELDAISINFNNEEYSNNQITSILNLRRFRSNNFKYPYNQYFYNLFFFPNLNYRTMITFKITYYIEIKNDTFNKLPKMNKQKNEVFKFYNSFNAIFFIYPCPQIHLSLEENIYKNYSVPSFFKHKISSQQILSYMGEGFISYHIYNENDYHLKNFTYNFSKLNDISLEIINKKKIRLSFQLFSKNETINYYLVIANKNYYDNLSYDCYFLDNYYINYKENDSIQRYLFESKNLMNNSNMTSYIDLDLPQKINIFKERKKLIYRLMGISKSEIHYVNFYPLSNIIKTKVFYYMDYILYIVAGLMIILLLIIYICYRCCKDNSHRLHYSILNVQELSYQNYLNN